MVHRALLGSLERFFALLIEHHAGAFPLWLAPVQACLIPIADRHLDYAERVAQRLRAAGLRVNIDRRNERMNAKIRDAQLEQIPYILVVGDKEAGIDAVAVRHRRGEDLGPLPLAEVEEAPAAGDRRAPLMSRPACSPAERPGMLTPTADQGSREGAGAASAVS